MRSTPAAYTTAIAVGHGMPTGGRASGAGAGVSTTKADGRSTRAASPTPGASGAVSAASVAAVRNTTGHFGSANDRIGRRRTAAIARAHTRWRAAADVRRYVAACTIAATPRSAVALMATHSAADMAGPRE